MTPLIGHPVATHRALDAGGISMTDAEIAAALTSILSLVGILVLFRLYRDYSVDRVRQDLFALRDEMFDFAAAGGVEFRHPAYGMLRLTMNGFLRWADRLNFLQIVPFLLVSEDRRTEDGFQEAWTRSLFELDGPGHARMNEYRDRMHRILVKHLLFRSPALVATIVVPAAAHVMEVTLMNFALRVLKNQWFDGVDAVALEYGDAPSVPEALPSSEHSALA